MHMQECFAKLLSLASAFESGLSAKAFHISEKFKPFKAIGDGDAQTQSSGQNPPKISNIKALEVALIPEFISNGEIWVIVPQ